MPNLYSKNLSLPLLKCLQLTSEKHLNVLRSELTLGQGDFTITFLSRIFQLNHFTFVYICRNKNLRIITVLNEIRMRLGIKQVPNITTTFSPEERKNLADYFETYQPEDEDKERGITDDYVAKRYFWHLPSCACNCKTVEQFI